MDTRIYNDENIQSIGREGGAVVMTVQEDGRGKCGGCGD